MLTWWCISRKQRHASSQGAAQMKQQKYLGKTLRYFFIHTFQQSSDVLQQLSYTNLFHDVRAALDYVHSQGDLKKEVTMQPSHITLAPHPHTHTQLPQVIKNPEKYIYKRAELSVLLDRLKKTGSKTFLLTNSNFSYTNNVMSYLLNGANPDYPSWRNYFGKLNDGDEHGRCE